MLPLLALLTAAPAHADGLELQFQGGPMVLEQNTAIAAAARAVGERDAYLSAEGRFDSDGRWMGRAGVGFDVLGRSCMDFKLGLFAGGVGGWEDRTMYRDVVAGTEITLGATGNRLFGQYRWLGGLGDGAVSDLHTENELTVGFRVVRRVPRVRAVPAAQPTPGRPEGDRPRRRAGLADLGERIRVDPSSPEARAAGSGRCTAFHLRAGGHASVSASASPAAIVRTHGARRSPRR